MNYHLEKKKRKEKKHERESTRGGESVWYQPIDENSSMLEKTIEKCSQYINKIVFNLDIIILTN